MWIDTNELDRRDFFARTCDGVLGAALLHLLGQEFFGGTSALGSEQPNKTDRLAQQLVHFHQLARCACMEIL